MRTATLCGALASAPRRLEHERVAGTINGQWGMFSTSGLSEQMLTALQRDDRLPD